MPAVIGGGYLPTRAVVRRTPANLVRFTILNVSPCSDQHTRSSETGDETISYSLSRKGATLSTSKTELFSSEQNTPILAASRV